MARHIFFSFLFALLILLVSPLPPAAGAGDASQAVLQDAEPAATVANNASDGLPEKEEAAFVKRIHDMPSVLDRLREKKAANVKKLIASGLALLLVLVSATVFDSFYMLGKVKALQEKDSKLSDADAYLELLKSEPSTAVLSSIIWLLSVGFGVSLGANMVKTFLSMKAIKDQEKSEKDFSD